MVVIDSIHRITLTEGCRRRATLTRMASDPERSARRRHLGGVVRSRVGRLKAEQCADTAAVEQMLSDLGAGQRQLTAQRAPAVVSDMRDLLVRWLRETLGIRVKAALITAETAPLFLELLEDRQALKLQHLAGQRVVACQQRSAYLRRLRKLKEVIVRQFPVACLLPHDDFSVLGAAVPSQLSGFTTASSASAWLSKMAATVGITNLTVTPSNCLISARLVYSCCFVREAGTIKDVGEGFCPSLSELIYQLRQAVRVIKGK